MNEAGSEAQLPGSQGDYPSPPPGFMELKGDVTTGIWDKIRLAAKFFTARVVSGAREAFIEAPKAVLNGDDYVTFNIQMAKRNVEAVREVGRWAVEQEMIAPEVLNR